MYFFLLHVYLMLLLQAEAFYVPAWINLVKSRIKRIKLTQCKNRIEKKARCYLKKLPDTKYKKIKSVELYKVYPNVRCAFFIPLQRTFR